MADADVRDGNLYTKDHEWLAADGAERRVGITHYAVEQLGDITMVDLKVKVGDKVKAGDGFGVVESVKSVSDLYAPISGTITAIDAELNDRPELVNSDPYGQAWMVAIQPDGAVEGLLDPAGYRAFLKTV